MLHTTLFPLPQITFDEPPVFKTRSRLRFTPRVDKQLKELTQVFHKGSGLTAVPIVPRSGVPQKKDEHFYRTVFLRSSTTLKLEGYQQLQGLELTYYRLPGLIPFLTSEYYVEMHAVFHDSPNRVPLGWVSARYVSTALVRAAQSEVGIRISNGTLIGTEDGTGLLSNK